MTATAILARECRAEVLKSARLPAFALPTIVLPVVFYSLFGIALANNPKAASYLLATFGIFAAIGPSIFGFGIGVATEREQGLLALKAVSPMPGFVYPLAKLAMTFIFVAIVLVLIYAIAIFGAGVDLPLRTWVAMASIHLASVLPLSLIGLSLGYLMSSQSAIATANIIFFGLSILGGLWMPATSFPPLMQTISWLTPTFHLAQLALIAEGLTAPKFVWLHAAAIAGWSLALAALTAWAVRRRPE